MIYKELKRQLKGQADVCRATLPGLAEMPDKEKSLDDKGLEFLMSGFMYLYDDYSNPSEEQVDQLRQTAATCAETYRQMIDIPEEEQDPEGEALLNLSFGFLLLYNTKFVDRKTLLH